MKENQRETERGCKRGRMTRQREKEKRRSDGRVQENNFRRWEKKVGSRQREVRTKTEGRSDGKVSYRKLQVLHICHGKSDLNVDISKTILDRII